MLALKNQKNLFELVILACITVLLLISFPASAKNEKSNERRGNQTEKKEVQKNESSSKAQQSQPAQRRETAPKAETPRSVPSPRKPEVRSNAGPSQNNPANVDSGNRRSGTTVNTDRTTNASSATRIPSKGTQIIRRSPETINQTPAPSISRPETSQRAPATPKVTTPDTKQVSRSDSAKSTVINRRQPSETTKPVSEPKDNKTTSIRRDIGRTITPAPEDNKTTSIRRDIGRTITPAPGDNKTTSIRRGIGRTITPAPGTTKESRPDSRRSTTERIISSDTKTGENSTITRKSMEISRSGDRGNITDTRRTTSRIDSTVSERRRTAENTTVVKVDGSRRISNNKVVIDSEHPVYVNKRQGRERYYGRPRESTVIYKDNHRVVTHSDRPRYDHFRDRRDGHNNTIYIYNNQHAYWDHYNRLCYRIVYPGYRYMVSYNWGPSFTFSYVYPYYHRKYVFVSLGGYWPSDYQYMRYYWYGYHPYQWYGYYPIAREVQSNTNNYYTYNYYNTDTTTPSSTSYNQDIDENTFADVRERMAQQAAAKPPQETAADVLFDNAVTAFEANDFNAATGLFAKAVESSPADIVLRFAYSQALFANEQFTDAARILREALEMQTQQNQEGVFYPRGLYSSDDVLFDQINKLIGKVDQYSYDGDLQLLLGYHFMGIGEYEVAAEPLKQASLDLINSKAAMSLITLLEKIQINDKDKI